MKANRKRYEPRLRWPDNPATAGRRLTPEEPAERGRSSSGAVQTDGVAILRDREERTRCWNGELLTSDRLGKAKAVVLDKLKPRKDGARASTIDGGMVIDRKMHVQAHKSTADAALVVLELVSKRFEGQALIVKGTDEFRFEAAQLAGMHGLCAARRGSIKKWRNPFRQKSRVRRLRMTLPPTDPREVGQLTCYKLDCAIQLITGKVSPIPNLFRWKFHFRDFSTLAPASISQIRESLVCQF